MAHARDVAAAILEMAGPVDPLKLQKLLYYAQGWNLAWYGEKLFPDALEAWTWGPVVDEVYQTYKQHDDEPIPEPASGYSVALSDRDQKALAAVLDAYAPIPSVDLSEMTHREQPWVEARRGYERSQRARKAISPSAIREFFQRREDFGAGTSHKIEVEPELARTLMKGDARVLPALIESSLGVRVKSIDAQ